MIVIQLSDPHILAPGELLYGRFDTAEFLARSVAEIIRLDLLPDVAVITGDLVDHGEPAEYERLRALLSPLTMPVFVIPGNHDAREPLRAAFAADGYLRGIGPVPRQGLGPARLADRSFSRRYEISYRGVKLPRVSAAYRAFLPAARARFAAGGPHR
jgi:predicted MPP superfamily phosphohydrolase